MRRNGRPTLLITGSNGQLGFELRRSLACLGEVIALDRAACDIAEREHVRTLLVRHRPDVVVNAAAYTAVDQAEQDSSTASLVNGIAPRWLAETTRDLGGLFVHYSTDYVFDGRHTRPYTEDDTPTPISVYGKTKLEGERAVMAAGGPAIVLRTAWLAGAHGSNFLKTILARARTHERLQVVANQIGTPTTAALVADATAHILARHWLAGDPSAFPTGVYHLAAGGETSWHAYACEILRFARACGATLQAGPDDVEACISQDPPSQAVRPAYAVLDSTRLCDTFGVRLPSWEQGIHWLVEQLIS
ncbi:dTDP-4-dehydrorhamnose reductase [Cupriavidus taiwanensis]|uniref:dTDP-4-dehydrorhamnose reductase n=1 Tax=Cupriavidus taiwanensis TaxID=164546 RepID=UPI000E1ACAEC|nr:dTDP-4-dehydrorhamnose reductase [Cupriavidus taiwanensis]SOY49479.1 dTDP-4-dehydrorhamnose reductase [Cupriavidus taiwanensis]